MVLMAVLNCLQFNVNLQYAIHVAFLNIYIFLLMQCLENPHVVTVKTFTGQIIFPVCYYLRKL